MKKRILLNTFPLCVFLMSSCAVNYADSTSPEEQHSIEDFFIAGDQAVPQESDTTFIPGLAGDITAASTNNKCIDSFNLLKETKPEQYEKYSEEYAKITDGFVFLNANKHIMDEGAKRIYIMELDVKIETLCTKIQYSNFILVNEKRKILTDI